ncbi:MAG: M50 family metallopeptidase [bacterium]|nr:M50 family metallopeptidase [bacterium]
MEKYLLALKHVANYILANSHLDFHSDLFKLFIFFVVTVILSFLVNFFLVNSILGPSYRVFVAPGIVVHEFSHVLICFLTGAKVTKISLFDKEGGSVRHQPSRLPVIGPLLISFAPFIFGTALIILFAHWLGLKSADLSALQPNTGSVLTFLKSVAHQIDFHDPRNWLFLYLALSVAVTMTPSRQDILNIAFLLVAIFALAFYLFQFTKFRLNLSFLPTDQIIALLTTVIILLIFSLVLSIVIFAASKIIKK